MKVKVSQDNMKVHQVSPSLDFDTQWWVRLTRQITNQPTNANVRENTREKANVTSLGRTPEREHQTEHLQRVPLSRGSHFLLFC